MPKPDLKKVPSHLHDEINLVSQDSLNEAFSKHSEALSFLKNIPDEKWSYRYAPDKWSIKGVVQHVIDAERIFCNRALLIARKDKLTTLQPFEEKDYGVTSKPDKRSKDDLISELDAVEESSRALFKSFDEEQLQTTGTVGSYTIDVNALGFVILGHTMHHIKILKERYLSAAPTVR